MGFLDLKPGQVDVKKLYTNDLIDEINNFDAEKIRQQARTYKVD